MKTTPLFFTVLLTGTISSVGEDNLLHTFKQTQLTDKFWSEGATFGDLNRDGKPDIASGPYWYEGPDFTKRHEYYPATTTSLKKDGTEQTIEGLKALE
jgi:hypothetical protein